ncbi:hypothetical protein GJAV_G00267980 [Gymnothorax javanicus]|nr:hypothetical protein GJAV_G00267980 [Gymnothorax javanicus]
MTPPVDSLLLCDSPVLVTKKTPQVHPLPVVAASSKTTASPSGPTPSKPKFPSIDLNKKKPEDILHAILPPRVWSEDVKEFVQSVSSSPATRTDVIKLRQQLDLKLQQRQARETGICPIRRELYSQCFDELIRQTTIGCAERGLLLLRVRDESLMSMAAYQTLYESSAAFGVRKALLSELSKAEMERKRQALEKDIKELEQKVKDTQAKCEALKIRAMEQREEKDRTHVREVEFLRRTNQQLMLVGSKRFPWRKYAIEVCVKMNVSPWPPGKKIIHLDLKGAPPRMSFLQKLIPLFAELGADALLMEYEDTFPYKGDLKVLQTTNYPPYSPEEIQLIQEVAKANGLEIIPLLQTFGHLEFVLKHREFSELREVPYCLGTLNPHKDHGVELVLQMVQQVLELHPDMRFLHIGADEVYLLGHGEESRHWLSIPGHDLQQMFLGHVTKVAKRIKAAWPHLTLIMWDDMLRSMSHSALKESGLGELVQPMLWDYSPCLDVAGAVHLLGTYGTAGLSKVWAASSFKGSTDVSTCVTCTQRHVDNHLQWLQVAAALPRGIEMQGIAITGWQRYDHLSVLCELLPVGLPSLASCLQTLCEGSFGKESKTKVMESLGISSVEPTLCSQQPPYPGQRLAKLVVELSAILQSEELHLLDTNELVKGWFSPYHRRRKITNPRIAQEIHLQATSLLAAVEQKVEDVRQEMVQLFHESTVQEWIEQHVSTVLDPIRHLLEDINVAVQEMLPASFPIACPGQQG